MKLVITTPNTSHLCFDLLEGGEHTLQLTPNFSLHKFRNSIFLQKAGSTCKTTILETTKNFYQVDHAHPESSLSHLRNFGNTYLEFNPTRFVSMYCGRPVVVLSCSPRLGVTGCILICFKMFQMWCRLCPHQ